jgi:hypothetical protein
MQNLIQQVSASPVSLRVIPFLVFVLPLFFQGKLGPGSAFWVYAARTAVGVGLILWMWPKVRELRWAVSWEAIGVGIAIFVVWVGLDPFVPSLGTIMSFVGLGSADSGEAAEPGWNPFAVYGD